MGFEVFDLAAVAPGAPEPMVRVTPKGRLLLNRPACDFLEAAASRQSGRRGGQVQLLFDREERVAAVRPAMLGAAGTAVFTPTTMRDLEWPQGLISPEFVEQYRIAVGEYRARPWHGTAVLAFEVGAEAAA